TDVASYLDSHAAVTVSLLNVAGIGGDAEGDTLSGIEGLVGSQFADALIGDGAANTFNGAAGADVMTGGAGDDTYFVDDGGDEVAEDAAGGDDTVRSSIAYVLGDNVERLTLIGADNIDGVGNALANTLTGNDGANVLSGGAGDDVMIGLDGDDTYVVDAA